MFAIPITPKTVKVIAAMNEGVEPLVEDGETFFVYYDQETPSNIISGETFAQILGEEAWTPLEFPVWTK